MTRMLKNAKLCYEEVNQKEKLTDMNLDVHSWSMELDTCTYIFDFQRLMDLSDTNLLYDWKRDSRIEVHPEGGLRTTLIRTGL